MEFIEKPANELERLSALYEYKIHDTFPQKEFDDIACIASELCQAPISLITFIDADRQWIKSAFGLTVTDTPRNISFCTHAILHPEEMLQVSDTRIDSRFVDNPFVTGYPHVVFYAGVPLITKEGYPLGTICVIDNKPRRLTASQETTLKAMANQVMNLLELQRKYDELEKNQTELLDTNTELKKFAYAAAHDLRSPCNQVLALAKMLHEGHAEELTGDAKEILTHMEHAMHNMKQLVDGILHHSFTAHNQKPAKETFTFSRLMTDIKTMLRVPAELIFYFNASDEEIHTTKTPLQQILLNLCDNAIKYNNKQQAFVKVIFGQDEHYYHFCVTDNGVGIPESKRETIFNLFQTLDITDRFNNSGTGIGLNTVQALVKKLDGKIRITSEVGVGTSFTVTIRK